MRRRPATRRPVGSFQYWKLFKPFDVLCQFVDRSGDARATLKDYVPHADVYPIGRLDRDSEGLLLLSNDGRLAHRLLDPRHGHPRTYLAQVEGIPDEPALDRLRAGVVLSDGPCLPVRALRLDLEPELPPRPVPIRFRKNVPTSWLELTLREGRNRQVRRMTAAIGFPTLRLVRIRMGAIELGPLQPGACEPLTAAELAALRSLVASEPHRRPAPG